MKNSKSLRTKLNFFKKSWKKEEDQDQDQIMNSILEESKCKN